jgi:hypothetical protein
LRWYKRRLTKLYFWWLHHSEKFERCGIAMSKVVKLDQMFNPQDAAWHAIVPPGAALGAKD